VCWLFPGRTVRIEAPCLDCGEPLVVEMREGRLLRVEPATAIAHLNDQWAALQADRPSSCAGMNLFRGPDHAPRWARFNPLSGDGYIPLPELAALFGSESRQHWLDSDYLSRWHPQRTAERLAVLQQIGKATPYWTGR
jgi:hypothetical protein